jgi:hypothetical protein
VVTCLQSEHHARSTSPGVRSTTGKGDHARFSTKTVDSAQWHFVSREEKVSQNG